ncbi:hypothetical protein [Pseudomonas putida]|jgi:hypothetical protein|uniref:hypothetical protein n=1 Tax=Pseudomonas putida TaxID=303 RepID=UPI00235BB339|nr:hypothetical protein [Pseudomonas putida]GLO24418.1 hypothetical protein PPUJ21368_22460 [Pseudomonas putida]HDS0969192.1 hypothetical protein [Pseudomonas putida]HEN8706675.1 hypothetical protein [Pseudomonas putida]
MNKSTRQAVVDIIDSRFTAICENFSDTLRGELVMAIDLAGLTGAIDIGEQRSYTERLNRIIERDHEQWMETNGRVA